ncbi:MAG TPA: DUF4167 domain-containing protein [Afifellaceae bacterium]|nr:DUF4167 domain-containing protein [Afifellaceae bacterium]
MRHNQNRRSRGRNNSNRKGPNPLTRSYESNGPDVKVRGTAMHIAEKYMSLARDAQAAGDIVAVENYLQHAEHYNRIVMAAQAQLQPSQPQPFRESAEDGEDDERQMNGRFRDRFDYAGEGSRTGEDRDERSEAGEDDGDERYAQPRPPRPDDRPGVQDDRRGPRPDRVERRPERGDRSEQRFDRGDRPEQRFDRGDRPERSDRPYRGERPERFDRPFETVTTGPAEREPQFQPAPQQSTEGGQALPAVENSEAGISTANEAPAPRRRRGRPPRAENGAAAEADAAEATPDGAAALAAFPD